MVVFDKKLLASRFKKALSTYDQEARVQARMAKELVSLLGSIKKHFESVLEVGIGTGLLTRFFLERYQPFFMVAFDLVEANHGFKDCLYVLRADAESLPFKTGSFDLIVSNATFQWFTRPKETLFQLAKTLKPQGILAFSTFGPTTMKEFFPKKRPPGILNAQEWQSIKPPFLKLLLQKEWQETLFFNSPKEALAHVKKTGALGYLKSSWSIKDYRSWERRYKKLAGEEGYPLTFEPIIMIWERTL
ncbi:methyltransferase domain-containing protein [Thermodesulfatator indicus]